MLNVAPSVLGRFSKISRNGKRVSEEETLENAFADASAPSTKHGSSEGKKARKKKERARNANRPRFRRRRCAARQRNVRKGEPEKGEAFATRNYAKMRAADRRSLQWSTCRSQPHTWHRTVDPGSRSTPKGDVQLRKTKKKGARREKTREKGCAPTRPSCHDLVAHTATRTLGKTSERIIAACSGERTLRESRRGRV